MKILFVAAEAFPFFKIGGLADVVGSLPIFLVKEGNQKRDREKIVVKVLLPFYHRLAQSVKGASKILEGRIDFAYRSLSFDILSLWREGVEFLFLDQLQLFDRDFIYGPPGEDYPDNPLRFSFFSYAALSTLEELGFKPDIIHCHDWHTALLPVYLKEIFASQPFYSEIKTVLTIHNIGYQGLFSREHLSSISLPERLFHPEGLEFYGKINFLKAGILWTDRITTVSPTYSEEIRRPEFGEGLEGVLQKRSTEMSGILNGIDYQYWNPETDPLLKENYGPKNLSGKLTNRQELCRYFHLHPSNSPVVGMVSRLVPAKGFDLVKKALPEILKLGYRLVILGSGLPEYENYFRGACQQLKGAFGFENGYHETLAHLIYGGADFFLMPSLFEPCGLGQMIALRYGTIPVVRRTGGLADSVTDFASGTGNGFLFHQPLVTELLGVMKKAKETYQDKNAWARIVANAFASDFSWRTSSEKYLLLYRTLKPPI